MATSTFKAETYRFLRLDRPTPEEITAGASFLAGTVHLPSWTDSEWLKQLTAEQLITVKSKRGFSYRTSPSETQGARATPVARPDPGNGNGIARTTPEE